MPQVNEKKLISCFWLSVPDNLGWCDLHLKKSTEIWRLTVSTCGHLCSPLSPLWMLAGQCGVVSYTSETTTQSPVGLPGLVCNIRAA